MSQFPVQFTKCYPTRRGEPFKMAQRPETPTTDQVEVDWATVIAALYAWG